MFWWETDRAGQCHPVFQHVAQPEWRSVPGITVATNAPLGHRKCALSHDRGLRTRFVWGERSSEVMEKSPNDSPDNSATSRFASDDQRNYQRASEVDYFRFRAKRANC